MRNAARRKHSPESVIQPAAFYHCKKKERLMVGDAEHLGEMRSALDEIVRDSGLTLFGSSVERYSNEAHHGYTYLAWIGESAIDIHTWPEHGTAIANTHVCNLAASNERKLNAFFKNLQRFFGSRKPFLVAPSHLPLRA